MIQQFHAAASLLLVCASARRMQGYPFEVALPEAGIQWSGNQRPATCSARPMGIANAMDAALD